MDFYDLVNKRRMVRNFSADPVDPAAIERILEAAKHGPSAGFTQGQDFIVVTDAAMKQRLAEFCGEAEYVELGFDPFISKAPVLNNCRKVRFSASKRFSHAVRQNRLPPSSD